MEAEREERIKYKKEEEEKHLKNHYAFKEMMEKYKTEAEEEKMQQAPNQNNSIDEPEENKSNISVSDHQNSIETIKLSTYNTEENQSTPNSSTSSRKKIDLNQLKDRIIDMKGESSFDQSSDDNRDNNSSRKESVDSIDQKNNIIGQMKKKEEEVEHKISSLTSQFDELE